MKNKELSDEELSSVNGGGILDFLFGNNKTNDSCKSATRVSPSDGCDKYQVKDGKACTYKCETCLYYNGHYVCTNTNKGNGNNIQSF